MDLGCQNQKRWVKMPYKGYQRVYRCDNTIAPFDDKKRRMIWYKRQRRWKMWIRRKERMSAVDWKFHARWKESSLHMQDAILSKNEPKNANYNENGLLCKVI